MSAQKFSNCCCVEAVADGVLYPHAGHWVMWCPGCTYRACRRMCETPFWPLSRPAPLRRTTGIFWSRRSTLPQASACHTRTRSGSRCEDIGVARPRVGWLISSTAILVHVYFVRYMHVVNICLYLSTYLLSMPSVVARECGELDGGCCLIGTAGRPVSRSVAHGFNASSLSEP